MINTINRQKLHVSVIIVFFLLSLPVFSRIYPQGGINGYVGPNKLFSTTPWAGLRFPLTGSSSLIVKFSYQNLSYLYIDYDEEEMTVKKKLTYLTSVYYLQKGNIEFYAAPSLILGNDNYYGGSLDLGGSFRLFSPLKIEGGIYLLREKSSLWFPDEEIRAIDLNSAYFGFIYFLKKNFFLNPKMYLSKNSEEVDARSYSIGAGFIYKGNIYFTLNYTRYSESAQYRFSGNYLLAGVNIYL